MPAPAWEAPFLKNLADTANVRAAAAAAGIDRRTAYYRREKVHAFRAAWDEALEDACDLLELKARERALKGESDTLLILLLKAHRPGVYRETIRTEHTGADGGPILIRDVDRAKAERKLEQWRAEILARRASLRLAPPSSDTSSNGSA
jgi:hypothetical protein